MIQPNQPGGEATPTAPRGVMALRDAGFLRRLLSIPFAAVAIVAMACGGSSDAAATAEGDPAASAPATLASVGEASDFEVSTPHDGVFDLNRLEGQPVLLNFWFPSCPPCRAELPDLQAAYEASGDEIQFLGVSLLGLDSAEEAQEFLEELGVTYPSGPDAESQMVRSFKIVGFPTTIFIDSDHNVVKKHAGILSAKSLESLINATVASGGGLDVSGS